MLTEIDSIGCGRYSGAWCATNRVLSSVPNPVPELEYRQLRPERLPEELQQPLCIPQLAAHTKDIGAPHQVPRRPDHVCRFLQSGPADGSVPSELWSVLF